MLFGDPSQFAIEAYHEPRGPAWAGFGRMALHMAGVTLGNVDEQHCDLRDAAKSIRAAATCIEARWDSSFEGHTDTEIFALLDRELYVDYGQSSNAIDEAARKYSRFNFLTNAGEQFDDVKTFLFATPDRKVHVLYEHRGSKVGSAICSIDSFVTVAEAFLRWFDAESSAKVGVA